MDSIKTETSDLKNISMDPSAFGGKKKSRQSVLEILKRPEIKLQEIYEMINRPLPDQGVLLEIETSFLDKLKLLPVTMIILK